MRKQEMKEFVEGLFLLHYLNKDNDENISFESDFDKKPEDMGPSLELLSPKISYRSVNCYSLVVTVNENSMALRFAPSYRFFSWIENFSTSTLKKLKQDFNLSRITLTTGILNIQCNDESFKDFLIWLFEELDNYKKRNIDSDFVKFSKASFKRTFRTEVEKDKKGSTHCKYPGAY